MNIMAVDSTFFHFFRYPVLTGEARLTAPDDAVITRQYARRLFGKENPVGKVVEYYGKDVIIRGVIDEPGCKTLLRFDMLVSYNLVKQWQRMDISLKRVLSDVNLDEINQVSNVFKKDKNGNSIRWKFHHAIRESHTSVYSFGRSHLIVVGRDIELHQYIYGIHDETFQRIWS